MALKSASSSKKSKLDTSDVRLEPKLKKIKVPSQFIVRPSVTNNKGIAKVFIHKDILSEIEDLNDGALVYLYKDDDIHGLTLTISTFDDGELNVIKVSKNLRNLGSLLLGDRISILKLQKQPSFAGSVTVAALDSTVLDESHLKQVEKALDDIGIICAGLVFAITLKLSDETISIIITDIDLTLDTAIDGLSLQDTATNQLPYSPLFLFKKNATQLEIASSLKVSRSKYPHLPTPITYKSLGGLTDEVKLLKSTVELPLHKSELFTQFGITPPRGILLHGPPGTGKTMLLRAIANETDAHVLSINGPSIVSKYLGETENGIRDIFIEARKYQPSIIFIDEIDSLAPSRNSDDSGEVESRVVATLLTLMDGMGDAGRLVVVAATNRPNAIDALLRRPGRFDQEIEIGIPDVDSRNHILQIQFQRMQRHHLTDEDILDILTRTHGYVGADLIALCRESVMKTIQRDDDLKVLKQDVELALLDIRPSLMREIFLEMPKVYWSDIGGQDIVKQKLKEMVQLPLEASDTFRKLGIKAPKGLLLYGPPGCSKTLTAKLLATESGLNFLAVKGPEIFNKYVGESEKSIREIFHKARAASPSIIFFDEIDAISQDRSNGDSSHTSNQVLTTLLNEIDGVEELNGVVIVAATNRPDSIDALLLRPGRLDRHIYVAPPDHALRLQILIKSCRNFNSPPEVNLEEIATLTEGCSGAEIALLLQEAGLAAIMEDNNCDTVQLRHFHLLLDGLSKGITEEMIQYYKDFADKNGISTV